MILWGTSQVAFHLYADDTPLTSESSSAELAKLAVKDCVRDIDAWMKANKLKMNKDKTELVVGVKNGKIRDSPRRRDPS